MEITDLPSQSWNTVQKIAFRFFCCVFILYIFPFPLDSIPFLGYLLELSPKLTEWYGAPFEAYTALWHKIIPWIGKIFVGLKTPITIFTNGSGDTTYDYVLLLTQWCFALIACLIWTLLDRKRISYNNAYYWLRVFVRYYLAAVMLGYGIIKVYHLQMPFPYLSQLVQPFGEKSPMGLAWSFIGYSKAYSAYTGWAEVIGGILLLFRRTTLLGSMTVFVVSLNIAMINYCYDVPVKLFSSMLLVMAAFLMAPDLKRLTALFLWNQPVQPAQFPTMVHSKKWKFARPIIKWLFIISILFSNISNSLDGQKNYGDLRKLPPLYGIYNTETSIRNNDTLAPLATDSTQWKQLIVQFEGNAQIKMMNDSIKRYNFIVDDSAKSILLYLNADTINKSTLFYKQDSSTLFLTGKLMSDSVTIRMKKFDINKFRLVSRGYHWINEAPYNR